VRYTLQLVNSSETCWSPNYFSDECGTVDEPRHGHIEYNKSTAFYRCDPNYQVEGAPSVRLCSDGRWSGEQCACEFICIPFIQSDECDDGQMTFRAWDCPTSACFVTLCIFFIFRNRNKILAVQSRVYGPTSHKNVDCHGTETSI
jgi:Sushi repeat (SCR repeat)